MLRLALLNLADLVQETICLQCLAMDLVEAGNVSVPLQQGAGGAALPKGVPVHAPDRIDRGVIVGVEDVLLVSRVAGNMDLPDAIVRDVIEVVVWPEAVV